jgi:hypothetical protein
MPTADVYRSTILSALSHRRRPWSELKSLCQVVAVADPGFAAFVGVVDALLKEGRIERVVASDGNSIYQMRGI